jgi:large subunit ribosomal protein L31e
MAETTSAKIEREYTIPLRRTWLNVPQYRRTGKSIKAIKIFIAKHMKVAERDIKNVKLDVYFNNELWFRGRASPPSKIKVKAIKENGIVRVELADVPEYVKFLKAKHSKVKKAEVAKPEHDAAHDHVPDVPAEKKDVEAKEGAVAEEKAKEAKADAKAEKHTQKESDAHKLKSTTQRQALQK